jgi:hypothetical protein
MFFEDRLQFLERHSFVMRLLVLDIRHGLPLKTLSIGKRFVNPFRRVALQELDGLSRCPMWQAAKQGVNVTLDSADFDGFHFVIAGDATGVGPEPFLTASCTRPRP